MTVSAAAFVNASPRIATVDGKRGVWQSRRLHHAVLRFVTDEGRDEAAYERILNERYGASTRIDDYASLTEPTGNESYHNFQPFHADEIPLLINTLEEMPAGIHGLEGMRYLVRRVNGLPGLALSAPRPDDVAADRTRVAAPRVPARHAGYRRDDHTGPGRERGAVQLRRSDPLRRGRRLTRISHQGL